MLSSQTLYFLKGRTTTAIVIIAAAAAAIIIIIIIAMSPLNPHNCLAAVQLVNRKMDLKIIIIIIIIIILSTQWQINP
jgi:hypothetical protein